MLTTRQKIWAASCIQSSVLSCRTFAGKGTQTRVRRGGVQWQLDLSEGIDFAIWLTGAFEPLTVHAYRKLIRKGDIVLDIGANIGAHTLFLAQAAGPQGKVYAFEPTDFAFTKLKANLALNPELESRIQCCQLMLMDSAADTAPPSLYASWPLMDAPDLHPLHRGRLMAAGNARIATLDRYIEETGLSRIDFIKIDIDGFECAMLRGASRMLQRMRPTMVMELAPHQLDEYGSSIGELMRLLTDEKYELQTLVSGAALPMNGKDLDRFFVHGGSRNVIAIPR